MKTNKNRFQNAFESVVDLDVEITEPIHAIYGVALEIDRLERVLQENAAYMAEQFADYASNLAMGYRASPPTGYSALRDMDADAATLRARLDEFQRLARLLLSKEQSVAILAALESSRAAS